AGGRGGGGGAASGRRRRRGTGPAAAASQDGWRDDGEARLLLPTLATPLARGVPALLARDARSAGAWARRRAAHPALRADPHARASDQRRAGREPGRARGVRRHRRAVVEQPRRPGGGHRLGSGPRGLPRAVRGRAPLHRPRRLAALGVRGAAHGRAVMDAPLRLTVWSDYLCPWCYVAATRLHRLRDEFDGRVALEWRSYLLRPYPNKKRTLEEFRTYTRTWARPAAEPDAPAFRPWESDTGPPSPSMPPHLVAKAAAGLGPDAFELMHERLLRAYFGENQDITDADTLIALWAEVGLPVEEFRRAGDQALVDVVVRE